MHHSFSQCLSCVWLFAYVLRKYNPCVNISVRVLQGEFSQIEVNGNYSRFAASMAFRVL